MHKKITNTLCTFYQDLQINNLPHLPYHSLYLYILLLIFLWIMWELVAYIISLKYLNVYFLRKRTFSYIASAQWSHSGSLILWSNILSFRFCHLFNNVLYYPPHPQPPKSNAGLHIAFSRHVSFSLCTSYLLLRKNYSETLS